MNFFETALEKWQMFCQKAAPFMEKVGYFFGCVGRVIIRISKFINKMRKVILAVPVAVAAVMLGIHNQANLPPIVGLDLQNNGEFSIKIIREIAVLGPVAITAACLLLMFVSRRTLTPWFVSLISLLLPLLILVTNTFPS